MQTSVDRKVNAPEILTLGPLLDGRVAEELWVELREQVLAGLPLVVVGTDVERVATACLQAMVAAARSAKARHLPFTLKTPSAVLSDAIAMLGLQDELLVAGAA